jgi:hypothetical protein
LIAALALLAGATANASRADSGVLNQTQVSDPTGDSGTGPDLSGLTVTTYADGTVSFAVQLANRQYLQPGETVQIFVDLNDDGTPDLNLSIWESFDPSYLARWTGSGWFDIRQLPELVQSPGSISVRLALSELRGDGAVPVAPKIQVAVSSATADSSGNVSDSDVNDWLPSATSWVDHTVNPAVPGTTTTTASTTTTSSIATTTVAKTPPPSPAPKAGKVSLPPVAIEPLKPLAATLGGDVKLRVLLKSRTGPARLFKVCTTLQPEVGLQSATQCRSTESTGAAGAVPFTITYRVEKAGTAHISVKAAAGTATAAAVVLVRVAKR